MEDTPILYYRSEFQGCTHKMDQPVRRREATPPSSIDAGNMFAQDSSELSDNDPQAAMELAHIGHGHPATTCNTSAQSMDSSLTDFGNESADVYEQFQDTAPAPETTYDFKDMSYPYNVNTYSPYAAITPPFSGLSQNHLMGTARYIPSTQTTMAHLYPTLGASGSNVDNSNDDVTNPYQHASYPAATQNTAEYSHFSAPAEGVVGGAVLGGHVYEPVEDAPVKIPKKRNIAKPRSRRTEMPTSSSSSSAFNSPPQAMPTQDTQSAAANDGLHFNNFADAEAAAYNRTRLTIALDDWQYVRNHPTTYVRKLVDAFHANTNGTSRPEGQQLQGTDIDRWTQFQTTHAEKMEKFNNQQIEAACWVLLKTIIEAHEVGVKRIRYHRSEHVDACSHHVDKIAKALRDYVVVRYDTVRLQRFDELVSSTSSAVARKVSNFKGNWGKAKREIVNDEQAKRAGIEYVPVLGEKRAGKRKAKDDATGGVEARPAPKRRATGSETAPKRDKGKGRAKKTALAGPDDFE